MAKSSQSSAGYSSTDYTHSRLYKIALNPKQKLQIEVITIDEYLQELSTKYPESRQTVDSLRDTLGKIVHLADGADVTELCGRFDDAGGWN
jgi:hypothetical protein